MKIRELYLKNFGKFSDKKIVLDDGINLFYGENEFGKTTIHTFIKSMLFGMERGRGRASANDTFSTYEPWENPNYYSGVLKFESGGKNFCLTRNFDKYGKSASLICEDDGEEFSLEHGDLESILDGLTLGNYENTIAVGQMKVETNQSLAIELQNYATNYYATGNSEIDLDGALNCLRNKKKDVEKNIRELQQKKEEKTNQISQEREFILRDTHRLAQEMEAVDKKIADAKVEKEQASEKSPKYGSLVFLIGVLIGGIISIAVLDVPLVIVAGVIAIYVALEVIKRKKREGRREPDNLNCSKFLWEKEHLQGELQEKQTMLSNLQEQLDELDEKDDSYRSQIKIKTALDIAMEKLTELSKDVHEELSIKLNEKASQILSEITGGKYEMLFVDEKLRMSLYTEGRRITIEQVSRGTIEQIYFALRMAASEILHEEEYPVILDDTFVYYDDKRLENTLKWLKNNKKQVLLFTCQRREREILENIKAI